MDSADSRILAEPRHLGADVHQSLLSATRDAGSHGNVKTPAASTSSFESRLHKSPSDAAQWVPFPLRWYFLTFVATLSLVLGIVVMILYWQSHRNDGLSSEATATFGWKFTPTFIAVLYTQLTTMLLGAVKRTEPFARMAKSEAPEARYTVLEKPKAWWVTFSHGFQKKRNGGKRSWAVILTGAIFIIAILGISPISAALLSTQEIQRSRSIPMTRFAFDGRSAVRAQAERETYLRTSGAIFQNYSTSPWISEDFLVMPFWPVGAGNSPWEDRSDDAQVWEAETIVFRTDLQCEKAEHKNSSYYLRHTDTAANEYNGTKHWLGSVVLQSSSGCQYNLTRNDSSTSDEAGFSANFTSWTDMGHLTSGLSLSQDPRIVLSSQCKAKEAIVMSTPWKLPLVSNMTALPSNLSISAYFCSPAHTMAKLQVKASLTGTNMKIDFDNADFDRKKELIPDTVLDLNSLQTILTAPDWYTYVPQPRLSDSSGPIFGGMSALVARSYAFNATEMMNDPELPAVAAKLRRRFFSEVLRHSFDASETLKQEEIQGSRVTSERRVLVSLEVAALLCALLLLSFFALVLIAGLVRPGSRRLNLHHDPSTVLGSMALVKSQPSALSHFSNFDHSSRKYLKLEIGKDVYTTSSGILEVKRHDSGEQSLAKKEADASHDKVEILRVRTLLGLTFYLILIIVALGVLYSFAQRSDLHQALFTYRANLKVLGNIGSFSPFSVVPTLFAVIVALWWETIDTTWRSLQPFVAMAQEPKCIGSGVGLSYTSSFWIFASAKAAKHRHWLLSLVTLGTFLVQALTIAMSALFEQGNGVILQQLELNRTLELRRDPLVSWQNWYYDGLSNSPNGGGRSTPNLDTSLKEAVTGSDTDWMYTAIIQSSLKGPEPAWSKDGWSFVPLDIANLANLPKSRSEPNTQAKKEDQTPFLASSTNITARTPALRGRIECTPVQNLNNASLWLGLINSTSGYDDLKLRPAQNLSALVPDIFRNSPDQTIMTSQGTYPQCCYNETKSTDTEHSKVTVGYWTSNYAYKYGQPFVVATGTTTNFSIKWVRGNAEFANLFHSAPANPDLYFMEQPDFQMLNCMPIIETAEAEIKINDDLGSIQEYKLLQSPVNEDVAWSDPFIWRNLSAVPIIKNRTTDTVLVNQSVTTSYGNLFFYSLLRASCLIRVGSSVSTDLRGIPDDRLEDKVFNMRDNRTGLNVDFMSYANLVQADNDPARLLDAETLYKYSQKTFSTFFQHFVSRTLSTKNSSVAYQLIGSKLQTTPMVAGTKQIYLPNGQPALNFTAYPRQDPNNRTTTVTISNSVEVLRMNVVAFWVASAILIWLIVTLIICTALQRQHMGAMVRNVECLADVFVLVAGSQRLMDILEEKGVDALIKENNVYTRLGWFRDGNGIERWGIEVVEDVHADVQMVHMNAKTAYAPVPRHDI